MSAFIRAADGEAGTLTPGDPAHSRRSSPQPPQLPSPEPASCTELSAARISNFTLKFLVLFSCCNVNTGFFDLFSLGDGVGPRGQRECACGPQAPEAKKSSAGSWSSRRGPSGRAVALPQSGGVSCTDGTEGSVRTSLLRTVSSRGRRVGRLPLFLGISEVRGSFGSVFSLLPWVQCVCQKFLF